METTGHHDVKQLEAQIKELAQGLAGLGERTEFDELIKIIYRRGYTTPAEWLFTLGITQTMLVQTKALMNLKKALLEGARAVVAE